MTTYIVAQAELWYSYRKVEATSAEEAKQMVSKGEGEEINLEYSHTLDSNNWKVEESKDE